MVVDSLWPSDAGSPRLLEGREASKTPEASAVGAGFDRDENQRSLSYLWVTSDAFSSFPKNENSILCLDRLCKQSLN